MMQIYYFTEGGYAEEYHVLASSLEEALGFLKEYCISQDITYHNNLFYHTKTYEHIVKNIDTCHKVYSHGQVYRTEVS